LQFIYAAATVNHLSEVMKSMDKAEKNFKLMLQINLVYF